MSTTSATAHRSRCPVCGLALEVRAGGASPMLEYEFPEWSRLCRSPELGGPSLCLAAMGGAATAVDRAIDAPDDALQGELVAKARL